MRRTRELEDVRAFFLGEVKTLEQTAAPGAEEP
jgi:hypothetical protein